MKRWHLAGETLLALVICGWPGEANSRPAERAKPTEAENRAAAEGAKPILDAIHKFKHRNGLWPNDLDELVPNYVKRKQLAGWRYRARNDGYWTLINYAGFPHTAVQYRHLQGERSKWEVSWGDEQADLKVPYTPPKLDKLSSEELGKNLRATMAKRIERYPDQIIHYQGLVTLLMERKEFAEARKACKKCLTVWPQHWWPNVTLAVLDAQLGAKADAEKRLRAWAARHKGFHHYFCLAHYHHAAGEKEKSFAALRKALESPIADDWANPGGKDTGESLLWSDEVYLRYAAILAYQGKQDRLCLAICDRWEKYVKKEKKYGDPGYAIFRAACFVKQGKFKEAEKLIDDVLEGPNYGYTFDKGVELLKKAARAKDARHVFDPTRNNDGVYHDRMGNELQLKLRYR
jgi:tetratricopeptide (TPR) repeat protein